jgi:hypothetical protein
MQIKKNICTAYLIISSHAKVRTLYLQRMGIHVTQAIGVSGMQLLIGKHTN